MVMLSATIDSPERFAKWCEDVSNQNRLKYTPDLRIKEVWVASTTERVVPLMHYVFLTANFSNIKAIKDQSNKTYLQQKCNQLFLIKHGDRDVEPGGLSTMREFMEKIEYYRIHPNSTHVLNCVSEYLATHKMCPAIFFTFSRSLVEYYAKHLTTSLIRDDDDDVFSSNFITFVSFGMSKKKKYFNDKIEVEAIFDGYFPPSEEEGRDTFEFEDKFKVSYQLTEKFRIYNLGEISKLQIGRAHV